MALPRGTWVRLAEQNFMPISARRWERGPKIAKISTFWERVAHRSEPFDRFLQLLGAFIRRTILHWCFTFEMIHFIGYGVIAEKPLDSYLPRIFPCTL